jgi:hypothetical protein
MFGVGTNPLDCVEGRSASAPQLAISVTAQACRPGHKFDWLLAFESCSHEVAVAPNQPAPAHRSEVIERYVKLGRHHVEPCQSNSSAIVGDIANATGVNAGASHEKQQGAAIDKTSLFEATLKQIIIHRVHGWRSRHGYGRLFFKELLEVDGLTIVIFSDLLVSPTSAGATPPDLPPDQPPRDRSTRNDDTP